MLTTVLPLSLLSGVGKSSSSPQSGDPVPTGYTLFALLLALVGLLGLFDAGSEWLTGAVREGGENWALQSSGLILVGVTSLWMAWALVLQHARCLFFSVLSLLLVVVAAVVDVEMNAVLDLAVILILGLAALVHMALIGWLWLFKPTRNPE